MGLKFKTRDAIKKWKKRLEVNLIEDMRSRDGY
jgi:hypothetical protein